MADAAPGTSRHIRAAATTAFARRRGGHMLLLLPSPPTLLGPDQQSRDLGLPLVPQEEEMAAVIIDGALPKLATLALLNSEMHVEDGAGTSSAAAGPDPEEEMGAVVSAVEAEAADPTLASELDGFDWDMLSTQVKAA
ncbi:hypothetical protein GGR56DRAFT_672844 [Xylariaceae sp. FL0804]|nr:hypothetical protein GGR56DRAFT_672844 [Xylariaceae sp. FL0804]